MKYLQIFLKKVAVKKNQIINNNNLWALLTFGLKNVYKKFSTDFYFWQQGVLDNI